MGWWYFTKLFEDETTVRYAYAHDSRETDGEIEVDKKKNGVEGVVLTRISTTTPTRFLQEKTRQSVYHLAINHFPDNKMVAYG